VAYKDEITVIGVGDIMMGTNFPDAGYLPPKGVNPLKNVMHILADADVTFGNLEGVILNDGGDPKECKNPDLCYLFRSPEYMAGYLQEAGFDLMSLANNHAGDFGNPGRKNTMKVLDSVGIRYAGLESCPYVVFQSKGIRYGLVAFAPNSGTISLHDLSRARSIVTHLDSTCNIVIASFHGGAEGKEHQHVTRKREFFHGEDRGNVYAFSRMLIDAGADIVFGHGPHITRAVDVYRDRFIAYSLGNFCTYARFNLQGPNGIAPIVKLTVRRDGTFVCGKVFAVRQAGRGVPEHDPSMAAIKKIRELNAVDLPELAIDIDALGNIIYLDQDF
jgi:poly-gamma-glutamate capsule biosynthesis protein CapA/YwtB (metallophosphatase superfamily)